MAKKARHAEAENSIKGFTTTFSALVNDWHEQAKSTLGIHERMFSEEKYPASEMVRDLYAETIGWTAYVWRVGRTLVSGTHPMAAAANAQAAAPKKAP